MFYRTMPVLAAAMLVVGCSDPKDVNEGNFKAALQGWFDEQRECAPIGDMPARIRVDASDRVKALYGALAQAGLLSVESLREPLVSGGRSYDYLVYRPTAEGEKVIRKASDGFLSRYELCFARRQVAQIIDWTEPGDMAGMHMSQVRYRYRIEDVASWASLPVVRSALPRIDKALSVPEGQDKASMILTNEGWRSARALRK